LENIDGCTLMADAEISVPRIRSDKRLVGAASWCRRCRAWAGLTTVRGSWQVAQLEPRSQTIGVHRAV